MISVRVSYGNNDTTGCTAVPGIYYTAGLYVSSITIPWGVHENTESWGNGPDHISFKEHMRRLRQSLQEMRFEPPAPLRAPVRPRDPGQGRHGFQQAYRLPGYRAKRAR